MRQAGVLAAAGLVALDTMIDRLAEDHENARVLAEGLSDVPGLACDADGVQTNIVMVHTSGPAAEFVGACRSRGLLALASGPHRVRLVTHYGIERDHIGEALAIATDAIASLQAAAAT
jgi:threonine aldolase